MREIKEADWKLLRQLHPIALERYCQTVLAESLRLHHAPHQTAQQRFLTLFDHFHDSNRELARLFDDPRRSTALWMIAGLRGSGWMTDEEFARFSEETQNLVAVILDR